MFNKKVAQSPLWAWVLVALSAPAAQVAASGPWVGVLAIGVLCGGLCWGIHAVIQEPIQKRWYCVAEFLFLILVTGKFAQMAASCWPTGNSYPTVSLTLLILAAFSALDGAERASRVGGVLFWLLALLYAIALCAGVKDGNVHWLVPDINPPRSLLVIILLLPVVAIFLPREKGGASTKALIAACVFTVFIAILTAGAMSPSVVKNLKDPFYEFSKSLSLFGVAERFEAIVSVALTLGYFALLSFLLSAAGHLADRIQPGWGRAGVLGCATAGAVVMLICPTLPDLWLAGASLLFWGFLPLATRFTAKRKSRKNEKKT